MASGPSFLAGRAPRLVPRVPEPVLGLISAGTEPVRQKLLAGIIGVLTDGDPLEDSDPAADYRGPAGDPGLFGPDSMTWRVHADGPSMMIAGVAALMLQTLHPMVMAGVEEHSNYKEDPLGRLQRTGEFVGAVTFAGMPAAEQAISIVRKVHQRVVGTAPDGRAYDANDPDLLCWVHTTEYAMFLRSYQLHAGRRLTRSQQDQYLAEVAEVAYRLGATWVPRTRDELEAYFRRIRSELYCGPQARGTLQFLQRGAFDDPAASAVYQIIQRSAQATLPSWARQMCGLDLPPVIGPVAEAVTLRPATEAFVRTFRWILGDSPQLDAARERTAHPRARVRAAGAA